MAGAHIWIMDGHNIIFAIPGLKSLQISDHRDEARGRLVESVRRFAQARSQKVVIVFDGNDLPGNPDLIRETWLEVLYSRRSDGVADDRILHAAGAYLERGHHVTVVTNDVRTLAGRLPRGVRHLEVEEFWRKYIDRPSDPAEKRVQGDFSEVEHAMEALAAGTEATKADPRHAPRSTPRPSAVETSRLRITIKREKGRLRQERLLKRRPKSGRVR